MTPHNPDSQYPFDDFLVAFPGEDLAGPPDQLTLPGRPVERRRRSRDCEPPDRAVYDRIMRQVWPLVTRGLKPASGDSGYYVFDVGRRLQPVMGHLAFTSISVEDQTEFLRGVDALADDYVDCQVIDCPIPPVARGSGNKPNDGWIRHKFVHELTEFLTYLLQYQDPEDFALGMPRLAAEHPWTLTGRHHRGGQAWT